MADLIAAAVASEGAVTGGTQESQARSWRRFKEYLDSVGLPRLLPQLFHQTTTTQNHVRLRHGYAAGEVFRTSL